MKYEAYEDAIICDNEIIRGKMTKLDRQIELTEWKNYIEKLKSKKLNENNIIDNANII